LWLVGRRGSKARMMKIVYGGILVDINVSWQGGRNEADTEQQMPFGNDRKKSSSYGKSRC
jgi:hypothetical protein